MKQRKVVERAVKLSPEQMKKLMGGNEPSRNIEDGLTHHDPWTGERLDAPKRELTTEDIRREIAQRQAELEKTPEWQQFRQRQGAKQAEAAGQRIDAVLLAQYQIRDEYDRGELDDNEFNAAMLQNARELRRVSPAMFQEFLNTMNDRVTDEMDDHELLEYEEASLPGNVLKEAVNRADQLEEGYAKLEHSQAMVAGLTERNTQTFLTGLTEIDVLPTGTPDNDAVAYYEALSEYVKATTGFRPGEIAHTDPEHALVLMERAQAQLGQFGIDQATSRFKADIVNADGGRSIADNIETGADREVAATKELTATLKRAMGETGEDALPPFDPEYVVPEERDDPTMTVGEFRRSVLEPEPTDIKHGFTDTDGNPISIDQASELSRAASTLDQ